MHQLRTTLPQAQQQRNVPTGKFMQILLLVAIPIVALYPVVSLYFGTSPIPDLRAQLQQETRVTTSETTDQRPVVKKELTSNATASSRKQERQKRKEQSKESLPDGTASKNIAESPNTSVDAKAVQQQDGNDGSLVEKIKDEKSNDPPEIVEGKVEQDEVPKKNIAYKGKLNCDRFGGPPEDIAQEMVYWKDIPSDDASLFVSPFYKPDVEQYLVFEPDESGWNNVRMAFETVVGMAIAMGRTLVVPPKLHFSATWDFGQQQVPVTVMGFEDFYALNITGLKLISFQEFLEKVALSGQLVSQTTGQPSFPPDNNRTDWTGLIKNYESTKTGQTKLLFDWLRDVAVPLKWIPDECVAAFPSKPGADGVQNLQSMLNNILQDEENRKVQWWERVWYYRSAPTAVNAAPQERLREMMTNRRQLCIYDEALQNAKVIHVYGEQASGYRMLIHFYAFLFSEDYKMDLYIKRFIRDKIRYIDQLHCAAARIVQKVRAIAKENGQSDGTFDSFHIRRNDFQQIYADVVLSADELYRNNTSRSIREKRTVFVATDEKDFSFFDTLREHYNMVFMKDFMNEITDIIPNYHGLVDELIAGRGDTFGGTFYSTFSGYIHRIRGYFSNTTDGSTDSYYYVPQQHELKREVMRIYTAIEPPYWAREFPVCWRDIDHDLETSKDHQNMSTTTTASRY